MRIQKNNRVKSHYKPAASVQNLLNTARCSLKSAKGTADIGEGRRKINANCCINDLLNNVVKDYHVRLSDLN